MVRELANSVCGCGHWIKHKGHVVRLIYRPEGVPGWWMDLRCSAKGCNCLRSVRVTP